MSANKPTPTDAEALDWIENHIINGNRNIRFGPTKVPGKKIELLQPEPHTAISFDSLRDAIAYAMDAVKPAVGKGRSN